MPYFDRTKKLANIFIGSSVISFVVACIVLIKGSVWDQVFQYSNGNFVSGGIVFTIFLLLSVFTLLLGIALKNIAKDAKEELDTIRKEIDNKKR